MQLFFRQIGSGEPLIVLHGLYGSSDNWLTAGRLLAQNFEVFLLDQRNHGQSPHSENHTYPDMSADLLEFMDTQGIEKATILGHSMGGKTALQFALTHPDRVKELIVADISPAPYAKAAQQSGLSDHFTILNTMRAIDFGVIRSRNDIDKELEKTIDSKMVRQFLLKSTQRNADNTFSWSIHVEALYQNLAHILGGLIIFEQQNETITQFPVLFIRGGKSEYLPDEDIPIIRSVFPKAEIQTLPQAGHWLHAEQPEEFTKIVSEFIINSTLNN